MIILDQMENEEMKMKLNEDYFETHVRMCLKTILTEIF